MINKNYLNDIEQLKKEVWYLRKNLGSGGGTDTSELSASISALQSRVSTLEGQMSTVQTSTFQNGSSIAVLSSNLTSLTSRVSALENGGGSGGGGSESINLIYDMRSNDSNINMGLTSGATCGTLFRLDYSVYKSIRLYCSINGCEVQKVIKVAERKKSDITVWAINSTFNQISYFRFVFPVNNTVLQVGQYCIYSYDFNNGNQLSVSKGSVNTNFYVYRLEGIY